MSGMLRLPQLSATTSEGQLAELRSYITQLIPELNWALSTLQSKEITQVQVAGTTGSKSPGTLDAVENFNQIKSLIIKSADIVSAYAESIDMTLAGKYVAQSDFGIYQQDTEARFEATSQGVTQNYDNIQTIILRADAQAGQIQDAIDRLGVIEQENIATSAYIKSGLLYYATDGTPVYGLEVGQTNTVDGVDVFNKFARFASDRLSFYDSNGIEVAYISDSKIYITEARITGILTLGGYRIDTENGLSFTWVGDEEI